MELELEGARKKARHKTGVDPASPAQEDHDADCDWISALPDEILVDILSRLPIRGAATTSCLARRWSNLWKSVTRLDLNALTIGVGALEEAAAESVGEARAAEFIRKVDSILAARAGATVGVLEEFSLRFSHLTRAHAAAMDGWWAALAESSTRSVRRFELRTAGKSTRETMGGSHVDPYKFQLGSLAAVGSQLINVKLRSCGLKMVKLPAAATSSPFSSLAAVQLEFVSATGRQVRSLLKACPSLGCLLIYCCHRITRLTVAHRRLRRLQVIQCMKLKGMWIRTPKLHSLSYVGHRIAMDYVRVPLLRKLELILLNNSPLVSPLDCLGCHPRLKTLSLQFLSPLVATDQLRCDGRFHGLHFIRLFLKNSWGENIVSVAHLLQAAPLLKALELEVFKQGSAPLPSTELKITWPEGCSANKLCKFTIGGFSGEAELIELALFLLQTSPQLKRMHVYTRRRRRRPMEKAKKASDLPRREHARAVALAKLAPRVPPNVKFTAR